MKIVQPSSKRIERFLEVPNLIELQLNSYQWFLEEGLPELFKTFSPVYDFTGDSKIELIKFTVGEPKFNLQECRDQEKTFEAPIRAIVQFGGKDRELIESEVYLGDLPLMTDRGTFIINGRERVIVSQLTRSPGLYFEDSVDNSMQTLITARLIAGDGFWLEIEADPQGVVRTQLQQTKKLPLTQIIKALTFFDKGRAPLTMNLADASGKRLLEPAADPETGEVFGSKGVIVDAAMIQSAGESAATLKVVCETPLSTNEEILKAFTEEVTLTQPTADDLIGKRVINDLSDGSGLIIKAGERIEKETAKKIESLGLESITVHEVLPLVEATLEQDTTQTVRDAALDLHKKMRPGDQATDEAARTLLYQMFFDLRRYDLGKVGRYMLNSKLGVNIPLDVRNLTAEDLAGVLKAMVPYVQREAERDDIDDLKHKRVRSVGELLQQSMRQGFARFEKVAREKMTVSDDENKLSNIIQAFKPISASIKSFFSSGTLSAYMDQTNPLSEITNKRRISSLGPGGLQRTSAKLEVRDVHRSHYGRICPIETPEGQNIGLISQLTIHARIDEFGFIITPYRKVVDGKVSDEITYLTAQDEAMLAPPYKGEKFRTTGILVAPADTPVDENGVIINDTVQVRCAGGAYRIPMSSMGSDGPVAKSTGDTYPVVKRAEVQYIDVSPVQIVSVATSLIPFLENDDANRALMGANMQRQAVPCLRSERPIVGTGYERTAAVDSGAAVVARRAGVVEFVTSKEIRVKAHDGNVDKYDLMHLVQSNKSTCFTQRPVVFPGQRVLQGDALADGPCVDGAELGLGKNVLVAFMPWNGYNYEDAILISERLVKDDVYTSIHIEKHDTEASDTKLGPEEVTRDIPNVGEDALKDLNEYGVVRVGAEVRPQDILVGKVAPKGQVEMTAEERLIIAIFGKKAEETRDVSLRLPHGEKGTVVDVKIFSRFKYLSPSINYIYRDSKKRDRLVCDRTDEPLLQLPSDDLQPGINMKVQVYTATKRKLMVGDKMAGRHGNKGVISKVLAPEDMPFLNDGTPVDIVLNPLGVPSRMNIGQILETHLGYVGKHLGIEYKCPAFSGATEHEILKEMDRLAEYLRTNVLRSYLETELFLPVDIHPNDTLQEILTNVEGQLKKLNSDGLERISRIVAGPPAKTIAETLEEDLEALEAEMQSGAPESDEFAGGSANASGEVYKAIMDKIVHNVFIRAGIDPRSCKSTVRDGLTGETLPNPITVGIIYMLKLEHLADEKIHARSTGPYSLVTQQPLGGKAQFGGQRFGEMEVWALEAYGAAYTLQELLTIKSDDTIGRVKAYESIVKGETIADPGIPESFKILVNELRSLCLKVTIEDVANKELPLNNFDELTGVNDDTRIARSVGFYN